MLTVYTKTCAKNIAGNNAVLVTEASNISSVTVDSNGEVTGIAMVASATFKELQADQDSIVRLEEATGNDSNIAYTHSVQMGFAKGSVNLNTLRDSLAAASPCGIVAIVQDSNGKSWLVGYNEVDKLKRALRLVTDSYTSGNSPADEDVQKADIVLESISGYPDLPFNSTLNDTLTAALAAGGGTAIEWTPGGYSTEYQSVYDAMTSKPSGSIASAQDTMVEALKTAGVWSKLDVFYMFAQHTNGASEALLNWKNPGTNNASAISSPAFTALEGFTGDGSADYINTNFNPSTDASYYAQNSACMGVYLRTNLAENGVDIACADGSHTCFMYGRYTDDTIIGRVNSAGGPTPANTDSRGLLVVDRSGASSTIIYKNGSALTPTGTNPSTGVPNEDYFILANNNSGIASVFSSKQVSCAFMGQSLSASEISDLTDAIEAYMDSNGKGVIT